MIRAYSARFSSLALPSFRSWAYPRIVPSGVLSSCATPAASWPMATSFSTCRAMSSSRVQSVMSCRMIATLAWVSPGDWLKKVRLSETCRTLSPRRSASTLLLTCCS